MRIHKRKCLSFSSFLFYVICFGLLPISAFAQKLTAEPITIGIDIGKTKITATLTEALDQNPPDAETSAGFFYRLENTVTGESYCWLNGLKFPATSAETILDLPNGTYTVVVYQSRKKRPIKPAKLSSPNLGNGNPDINGVYTVSSSSATNFPETDLGGTTTGLFSSWNIFTEPYTRDAINNPVHITTSLITSPSDYIPSEEIPWVLMTLVKENWTSPSMAKITYPPCLVFGGLIADNVMWDRYSVMQNGVTQTTIISSVQDDAVKGTVTLTKGTVSGGTQDVVHLIFEKKPDWVGEYPKDVSFTVAQQEHPDSMLTEINTFTYNVSPKPHDPNRLEVDKKTLCECGSNEELTYRIQYQNDGNMPTDTVTVTFIDATKHFHISTIQHNGSTHGKHVPISQNLSLPNGHEVFTIDYVTGQTTKGLPGIKQNSAAHPKVSPHECDDYFYVRLKKKDCLPAGTLIKPQAKIEFKGTNEVIYTNLEETMIVDRIDCEPCPPNNRCPKCTKKKPCWLFRWLVKDEHK